MRPRALGLCLGAMAVCAAGQAQCADQIYELKPTAMREQGAGSAVPRSGSASALHAKTFAVDRRRIFVGSFNFDQRSAHLNT